MLNEKEIQTLVKEGFDLSFIEKIQPQGALRFLKTEWSQVTVPMLAFTSIN